MSDKFFSYRVSNGWTLISPKYRYSYGSITKPENEDLVARMEKWCEETFGNEHYGSGPNSTWYTLHNSFWFLNQSDVTIFVLRWVDEI
jgi:hypothetical protein